MSEVEEKDNRNFNKQDLFDLMDMINEELEDTFYDYRVNKESIYQDFINQKNG